MIEPILTHGGTAAAALVVKWVYDRYMSKDSRVTAEIFKMSIERMDKRLEEGQKTFERINTCMATMCLVILNLCEKTGADCTELKKRMAETGLNL